jgi:hypothetical protein
LRNQYTKDCLKGITGRYQEVLIRELWQWVIGDSSMRQDGPISEARYRIADTG